MLITLYTPIGIEYQKFTINENDITYGDLLKYINLPKMNYMMNFMNLMNLMKLIIQSKYLIIKFLLKQ